MTSLHAELAAREPGTPSLEATVAEAAAEMCALPSSRAALRDLAGAAPPADAPGEGGGAASAPRVGERVTPATLMASIAPGIAPSGTYDALACLSTLERRLAARCRAAAGAAAGAVAGPGAGAGGSGAPGGSAAGRSSEAGARGAGPGAAPPSRGGAGGPPSLEAVRGALEALPGGLLAQLPALLGAAGLSATAADRVAACLRALVAVAPVHQPLLLRELEAELGRCGLHAMHGRWRSAPSGTGAAG